MNTTQVAVDLAKSVFQIAVSRSPGRVDEQHRLSRTRCYRFFAERSPVEVLMEACGTAHHWGRELESGFGRTCTLITVTSSGTSTARSGLSSARAGRCSKRGGRRSARST